MNEHNQPYYLPIEKEVEVFEHCYQNRLPILLKGPTGTGKSRFVEYMAHQLNKPLITVACHEETSATDLIGRFLLKGTETVWVDGPLTKAVKEGALIYLDEIAEARPDIIVAIHPLTDHRRKLYIDKLGETIEAHPDFSMIVSFNPGYQKGFKELKPSTKQRFVALSFHYPSEKAEVEILLNETKIDENTAKSLVKIAEKINNPWLTALYLNNIGYKDLHEKNFAKAYDLFRRALKIALDERLKILLRNTLNNLAEYYRSTGDWKTATRYQFLQLLVMGSIYNEKYNSLFSEYKAKFQIELSESRIKNLETERTELSDTLHNERIITFLLFLLALSTTFILVTVITSRKKINEKIIR